MEGVIRPMDMAAMTGTRVTEIITEVTTAHPIIMNILMDGLGKLNV